MGANSVGSETSCYHLDSIPWSFFLQSLVKKKSASVFRKSLMLALETFLKEVRYSNYNEGEWVWIDKHFEQMNAAFQMIDPISEI